MFERFEDFTSYVSLAYKYIIRIKSIEMQAFGLRASHVMCLFHIGRSAEGLTAVELVELCREDKAGISKTLAALREGGLIKADDETGLKKYRTKWQVTDQGSEVCTKLSSIITTATGSCGSTLTSEEREVFYRAFGKIVDGLGAYCEKLESESTEN